MDLWVNLFGGLGIISTVVVYQQRLNRGMLVWKLITDLCWVFHYLLMGANSVAVVTIVAIMRTIVLLCQSHKWARHKAWLGVFILTSLLLSVLAWKDWTSLLTTVGSQMCIVAFWIGKPKLTRLISIPVSIMFLINVALNGSIWGTVCESFLLTSAVIGFIRLDITHHKKQTE